MTNKTKETLLDEYGKYITWSLGMTKRNFLLYDKETDRISKIVDKQVLEKLEGNEDDDIGISLAEEALEMLHHKPIKPFKTLLRRRSVSGSKLSRETDIPQQTVSSWSSGATDIKNASFINIVTICKYLEINLDEFWKIIK